MRRQWLVVLARLPAEPARHRMAVWRELRRSGAIALGQAVWAVPDLPAARPLLSASDEPRRGGRGTLLLLAAKGFDEARTSARLEQLYTAAREEEWAEFARGLWQVPGRAGQGRSDR